MNNSNDIYSKQLEAIKRLNEAQDSFDEVQNDLKDKYSVSHLIGSGAYGSVWRGTSLTPKVFPNESTNVAIKRIRNRKNVLYCLKRTLREIKILRHFKHDNIVSLCDVIISQNESSLYLVLDLMETDLHKIIQSPQPLSIDHVRWFLYQILRALKFLHSANVVHRDIKPSNLLVNSNCLLKLADFGMARCLNDLGNNEVSETSSNPLTACNSADGTQTRNEFTTDANVRNHKLQATIYVATRWYRSPELILCHSEYTTSIDMWSVGCIVAELFLRRPLFPGKSQVNQLNLIISLLGNPKPSYIEKIKSDSIRAYVNSLPALTSTVSFRQKIPTCESREALDFIQRLLIWEPNDRLPSELAIAHPFLKAHYRPDQEPICCRPYDYAFESSLANCEQLHNAVLNEIERIAEQKRRLIKLVKKRELEKQCDWSSSYTEVVVDFTKENKIENFANESESEKACDVDSESGRVKREQSLEVKARLRAAILSDAWRSKGQRRTRTGRPKNSSKVSKKKIEETRMSFMPKSNIVPNHEKESAKLSGASSLKSPVPSISKQELMSVTQFKQPAGPITVKIITGNAHDQSRQQVVTLSFVQPKAANAVIAKGGKLPVPKLSCAKNNAANAALKAANLNAPTSMSRANLVKSVQAVSKRNETMNKDAKLTDAASAMLSAIPRVCNPSAATIPTSLPSFSLNASVKNNKAFDESLTDTRKSSCVSSKQQILIGADSHQGSKSDFANLKGASPAKKPVKSNVGLLPIDHCSYISMPESNASPQNLQSSANDTDIRFFSDVNNRTKPSTSQRGAKGEVVANRASVTENKKNLGEYRTSESVNLGAESDVKIDKMQAFLPSLYMDNSNWIGTGKPNRDKSDAQMPSARLVASVVSSASTEPGNAADEMDDLINKMSSSSLRPELDAFAEFLDIPLSAVLTGNDDKLVNSKVSTPSLPMHTSPCGYNCLSSQFKADYGGGQFIPESHGKQGEESQLHNGHISTNQNTVQENSILANPNAAIQAAFPANPIAERQNSSIANQSLDRPVSFNDRDFRAAFDITSAEMQDIENELKKDFSFLDFSLLELESPS